MYISPEIPFGNFLLLSSQIIISVRGFVGWPVDPGFSIYSSPEVTAPAAFVSVKPYPSPGFALGNSVLSFFTWEDGLAAPPPDKSFKDDKSKSFYFIWF